MIILKFHVGNLSYMTNSHMPFLIEIHLIMS